MTFDWTITAGQLINTVISFLGLASLILWKFSKLEIRIDHLEHTYNDIQGMKDSLNRLITRVAVLRASMMIQEENSDD